MIETAVLIGKEDGMAFIYDAEIRIHSVIEELDDSGLPTGEPEVNINTVPGFLKYDRTSGDLTVSYVEHNEGERTLTDILLSDREVRLTRRGALTSDMIFRESEESTSLYTVGPYSFDMKLNTKRIRSDLTKDGGELSLIYTMNVGGAGKAARMKIRVTRKNAALTERGV